MTERVQTDEALTPCPFCAGEPLMYRVLRDGCRDGEIEAWAYYVTCRSCAAQGGWGKAPSSGARWWNMRPLGPAVPA